MSQPATTAEEEVLWDEIVSALTIDPKLNEAAFAQLQGSPEPFQVAMAIRAALPPSLRQRSQQTLRAWAAREAACIVTRQEQKAQEAAAIEERKAAREHELALLRFVSQQQPTSPQLDVQQQNAPELDLQPHRTPIAKRPHTSTRASAAQRRAGAAKRIKALAIQSLPAPVVPRGKCEYDDCEALSNTKGLCCRHGGGQKLCEFESGCVTLATSKGLCKRHGGGKMCEFEGGCGKRANSKGLCIAHGGGRKCEFKAGCDKNANKRGLCSAHGGGNLCQYRTFEGGCQKQAQRKGLCRSHGADSKRAAKRLPKETKEVQV